MNHVMRKGTGPVTAQSTMTDAAFLELCAAGTAEDVRQALHSGANVDAKDAEDMTALMHAAKCNADLEVMEVLLRAAAEKGPWYKLGKKVNVNAGNKEGMTALMLAVGNNSPGVVKALLNTEADINAKDKEDKTALIWAVVKNSSLEVVKLLLEAGADISVMDKEGRTALMWAREKKASPEVVALLQDATPLSDNDFLQLCATGTAEAIRKALGKGAKINAKNEDDMTVLMYAARDNADPEVMTVLLDAAAEFNKTGLWQKGKSKLGFKTVDVNDGNKEGMTALMFAAGNNSPEMVRALLNVGADANLKDKQGMTALMFAVGNNLPEAVQALLDAGADANAKDKQDKTALIWAAVKNSSPEMVKILLSADADVNAQDKEGKTALVYAREGKCNPEVEEMLRDAQAVVQVARTEIAFLRLCSKGTPEDVRQALKVGANIDARDERGMTALMYAARGNADPEVMTVLLDAAAEFNKTGLWQKGKSTLGFKTVDVNDGNKDGMTALMFAVENNSPDVVQVLLDAGADVNAEDKKKRTALDFAKRRKSSVPEMVKMLLDAGASARKWPDDAFLELCKAGTAEEIREALECGANINAKDKDGRTVLMFAVENNSPDIVLQALMNAGADANAKDKQDMTALMYAAKNSNPEAVKVLLEGGADATVKDKQDMTVLMWAAAENSNSEVATMFLSKKTDLNAKNKDGKTALICAAEKNPNSEMVQKLLKAGASLNVQDEEGMTALMYAAWKNFNPEVVKVLLNFKADIHAVSKSGHDVLWYAKRNKMNNQIPDIIKKHIDPIGYYIEKIISVVFNKNRSTTENVKYIVKGSIIIIILCILIKIIIKIMEV